MADLPDCSELLRLAAAKGPFHRFALFSARLFARPARNQPLHCPRGQYIYREERPTHSSDHPPPPPSKFSKIRADRFFSFSRALLTWSDSPDSRVDSAIIGNNRDIDWLEIISVGRMAKIVLFLESVLLDGGRCSTRNRFAGGGGRCTDIDESQGRCIMRG